MAMSSQGIQDDLGAKLAGWPCLCLNMEELTRIVSLISMFVSEHGGANYKDCQPHFHVCV